MSLESDLLQMGARARTAALALALVPASQKNAILLAMAEELVARETAILAANALDMEAAAANGLTSAIKDRLFLDSKRLRAMADGVRQVASLPDPVGEVLSSWSRPNGLRIEKSGSLASFTKRGRM